MRRNKNKFTVFFATAFVLLLIVTAIVNYINKVSRNIYVAALSILCIAIPFSLSYIAKKKRVILPIHFNLVVLGFLFCTQFLGELVGLYFTLWWWDLLLHGFAGLYAVIIGIYLVVGSFKKGEKITENRFTILCTFLSFCFSVTLSTLWEVFEYIGDSLLGTNMLQEGLKDTFGDLIAGIGLAVITGLGYYLKARNSQVQ